eukprot:jgi/Bigna1/59661/fgenesh1_kg.5_\
MAAQTIVERAARLVAATRHSSQCVGQHNHSRFKIQERKFTDLLHFQRGTLQSAKRSASS